MDWGDLAEGREQWRALVSTVINCRKMLGYYWLAAQLSAFQEGLSSINIEYLKCPANIRS